MLIRFKNLIALAAVLLLSACAGLTPRNTEANLVSDRLFAEQIKKLDDIKNTNSAQEKQVIYVGAAMHSQSKAFLGDIQLAQQQLSAITTNLHSVLLSNEPVQELSGLKRPFATKENLARAFQKVAQVANKDTPVVILISTHGHIDLLAQHIGNTDFGNIYKADLHAMLEPIQAPVVLILSACHSGSFLPQLGRFNRVVLTAASRDRNSFGCSFESGNTYFIEELFKNNYSANQSIVANFRLAKEQALAREKRMNLSPSSDPQIAVGGRIGRFANMSLVDMLTKNFTD